MEKTSSNIPGTKLGSQNTQLLVSSGIPALDNLLGGGLPVGTVALIEEDIHGLYAKVILKYFLADGIVEKQSIFVASQDVCPYKLVKELPAVIETDPEPATSNQRQDDKLRIAFRYQNVPTVEKELTNVGHHFDLSKTMPPDDIENSDIFCWNGQKLEIGNNNFYENPAYNSLLKSINDKIKDGKFFLKDNPSKCSVLRIGVHSLGSPMWLPQRDSYIVNTVNSCRDLEKFLFCLRALVRSAYAVAVVTIPSHLYQQNSLRRCIHSSDIAMRLQSFSGTELEHNRSLSDFHGFFHLTKLAAINSLASRHPGSAEYVFKLRRKKFVLEMLHLPPDLEDVGDNKRDKAPSLGCGSTSKHLLEF